MDSMVILGCCSCWVYDIISKIGMIYPTKSKCQGSPRAPETNAMSALPRANAGRLSKSVVADRALGSRHLALVIWMSYESIPSSMYIFCGFPQGCVFPHFHDLVISLNPNFCWTIFGPPGPLPFFWVQFHGHLMASHSSHNGHWAPHVVLQGPHRAHRARRGTGAIHEPASGEALGRRRRQGRAIRTCDGRGLLGELNQLVGIYSHASILYTI